MKNKVLLKIAASAFLAAFTVATSVAQNNLGAECGCPPVSSRDDNPANVINLSTLANVDGQLTASTTLDCNKIWVLDKKIYVPNGITITINPGTVIKGKSSGTNYANAAALIIERGGKIMADGTQSCPIVFTSEFDDMTGSYALTNVGKWGGVAILGSATNNLIVGQAYCPTITGIGFIEGFSGLTAFDRYGAGDAAFPTFNDNDNSGIMRYVKIKHAGALLGDANELNGLSLGSVGSGTTIEHIEIVANADDNIEVFGGTVNLKYITTLFGDDDMIDYDLGWNGKAQFLFGIAGDSVTLVHSTDNGFEADGDDGKAATGLKSRPTFYNVTLIGNGHIKPAVDNTGAAAIQAKELTGGAIYNSIFANFRSGLHLADKRSVAADGGDAYDNWTNATTPYNNGGTGKAVKNSLIVKNNTFIGFGNRPTHAFYITKGALTSGKNATIAYKAATAASADDITQFTTTDGNSVVASVPGIDFSWAWNGTQTGYEGDPFHATPTTNIISSITPPADGFYSVVNYRGAFDANKGSWLTEWASNQILTSLASNPTDLNNDGITNIGDFSIFVNEFNKVNK